MRCLLAPIRTPGPLRRVRRSLPTLPSRALVYHFGTRKLAFLKTPQLLTTVQALAEQPDVHSALVAAGVAAEQRPAYLRALAGLAASGTIEERT